MSSERKRAANRANGKKSRGPKTAEGRHRSSANALKHGLSLPVEKLPELAREVAAISSIITRDYPTGSPLAVHDCAISIIELRRCRAVCDGLYALAIKEGIFDVPPADLPGNDPVKSSTLPPELAKISELLEAVLIARDEDKKPLTIVSSARQLKNLWRYQSRSYAAFTRAALTLQSSPK